MPRPRNTKVTPRRPPEPQLASFKHTHYRPHVIINTKKKGIFSALEGELEDYFRAGVPVRIHTLPAFEDELYPKLFPVFTAPRTIREHLNRLTHQIRASEKTKVLIRKGGSREKGYDYYYDTKEHLKSATPTTDLRAIDENRFRPFVPNPSRPNGPYYNSFFNHDFANDLQRIRTGDMNPYIPPRTVEPIVQLAQVRSQGQLGYNT